MTREELYNKYDLEHGEICFKKEDIHFNYEVAKEVVDIQTLIEGDKETRNTAQIGDYIVTGVKGEKYVLTPEQFEKSYVAEDGHSCFPKPVERKVVFAEEDFEFEAPWGEMMKVKKGDALIFNGKDENGNIDVYRIEREIFYQTYVFKDKEVENNFNGIGEKMNLKQIILRKIKVDEVEKLNNELQENGIKVNFTYMNDGKTLGVTLFERIKGEEKIRKLANILAKNLESGTIDIITDDKNDYLSVIPNEVNKYDLDELKKEGFFSLKINNGIEINLKAIYMDDGSDKIILDNIELDMEETPIFLNGELREKNGGPYIDVDEELQQSIEDLLHNNIILNLETNEVYIPPHKQKELEAIKSIINNELNSLRITIDDISICK